MVRGRGFNVPSDATCTRSQNLIVQDLHLRATLYHPSTVCTVYVPSSVGRYDRPSSSPTSLPSPLRVNILSLYIALEREAFPRASIRQLIAGNCLFVILFVILPFASPSCPNV